MWAPDGTRTKLFILAGLTAVTLAIHYGWITEPIFGHVHWIHALHSRFCYIPIVAAAAWFGLRGGLFSAIVISVAVMPYIFMQEPGTHDLVGELVEIVFYFFIGGLIGALVDREWTARRQQQEAQIQVERSQKLSLVGQMAAGVAHEIKNPLASIKGAADILASDKTDAGARREFRGILQDEVRRIDNTVGEFLAFARPKETRAERVDLSELVRGCVRQVGAQAKQSGVEVKGQVESGIQVNGDGEKLQQMTLNLILNALQASEKGHEVIVRMNRDGQVGALLEIVDTGSGISPEAAEHAFDPFFTTKSSGTGLGLAIVRSIVDNHGGEVALEPRPEGGTIARVRLPVWGD